MARQSKKQNKPYDDAFKLLAEQDAEALLVLLGEIKPGEQVTITPLGRELRVSTLLPDQAYKVRTASGERIVHIEAQTRYPNIMPDRMADYGVREWLQNSLPVTCYVLLLTDEGLPQRPSLVGRIDAGDVQITVRFRLIRLSQVSAQAMLALQRDNLLPFIPLMRGGEAELHASARKVGQIANEQQQLLLGFDLLVLGALRYNPADLLNLVVRESMIPLSVMKESPAYEFLVNEAKDQWFEEGALKAVAKGLRMLIAERFPGINVTRKINRIHDVATLQQLLVEVGKVKDAAALQKLLDAASKAQSQRCPQ